MADLLDKLRLFAIANSWTVDRWSTIGSVKWLHIHNSGGSHYDLASNGTLTGYLSILGATGYSGTDTWNTQPNQSAECVCDLGTSAFVSYWFFGDTENLYAVVELSTGVFRHFCLGKLQKFSTFTGGEFITTTDWTNTGSLYAPDTPYNRLPFDGLAFATYSYSNCEVRAEIDSKRWFANSLKGVDTETMPQLKFEPKALWPIRNGILASLFLRSPNTFNALTVLFPIQCLVERNESELYSMIGEVKNIRYVNIANLAPRQEITLGSDTWKIFPCVAKGTGAIGTGNYGLAYRKVA